VTHPSKEAFLPSVVLISGNEVSAPLSTDVEFDAAAGTLTVSTRLDHFSTWTMTSEAFFTVYIKDLPDQLVGKAFWPDAGGKVTADKYYVAAKVNALEGALGANSHVLVKLNGKPWLVGEFSILQGPIVSETGLINPNGHELAGLGASLTVGPQFRCTAAGPATIAYTARILTPVAWEWLVLYGTVTKTGTREVFHTITIRGKPFQCKATLPTVPPTAYVSEKQNAAPQVSPIQATLGSSNITRYVVVVSDADGDILDAKWEGPDCGTWGPKTNTLQDGKGEFEMRWQHTNTACHSGVTGEPNPIHAPVVITVTVSDRKSNPKSHWAVSVTYTGVSTGTGPPERYIKLVEQ